MKKNKAAGEEQLGEEHLGQREQESQKSHGGVCLLFQKDHEEAGAARTQ